MPWIDSLDWTSLNSLRRYPIREGASALSTDGLFNLPDTLIVDFSLCASSDVSRKFFVSKVFNKLDSIVIEISDHLNNIVGSLEVTKSTHTLNKDYFLTPTSSYIGANGKVTVGVLDDLASQPAGIFYFTLAATEFEPRTIIPGLQGVDRIQFLNSSGVSYTVTGDVVVTARNNINFNYSNLNDEDRIYMDAGDGLGLNKPCALSTCIKTINGVSPDSSGNLSLLGISCLSVSNTTQYTLDIKDTCCTPCSGCNDLEVLTTRLTALENKFLELKTNYNSANNLLSTYLTTVNSNCACPS